MNKKIISLFAFMIYQQVIYADIEWGKREEYQIISQIENAKKIWDIIHKYKGGKVDEIKNTYKHDKCRIIRSFANEIVKGKELNPIELTEIYKKINSEISKYDIEAKKKYLFDKLTDWDCDKNKLCVMQYEAAALHLIEMGNNIIPDIFFLLDKYIPEKTPPPYTKQHTIFSILIDILKSVPDERSIDKLKNYETSQNPFVAKKSKEAIIWIKSGVAYPYQYERILLKAEDEVYPSGNE